MTDTGFSMYCDRRTEFAKLPNTSVTRLVPTNVTGLFVKFGVTGGISILSLITPWALGERETRDSEKGEREGGALYPRNAHPVHVPPGKCL